MPRSVAIDILHMPEAGYDLETCLAFDEACVAFVRRFERMRDATKMVDPPKRSKREKAQVPGPKHTEEELLRVLGVDPEDEETKELVAASLAEVDWDAIDWDDDGEGGADGDD